MPPQELNPNDRRSVARYIVRLRYPDIHPDTDITTSIDEAFEKFLLVDFYNGPVARWLHETTPWGWLPLTVHDLADVRTVRDLGRVCFAHVVERAQPLAAVRVDVLADDDGEGDGEGDGA